MRFLTTLVLLSLLGTAQSAGTLTERRISSDDIGTLVFSAPEKWKGVEGYDELEAAAVYDLSSRKEKFSLRISIKNAGLSPTKGNEIPDEAVIARLDGYLDYAMADYVSESVEGTIKTQRFGNRNLGVYARITDKSPGKGEYLFFSHGARIVSKNFIAFSLFSNDKDRSVLSRALDVVTSFRSVNEWVDAPDAFLCKVEQLAGFGIVDEEWNAITSKNVKHSYIVRRSRPGDAFADASEWVFSAEKNESSDAYCDNELIARGVFVCNGLHDEEFRMDSKTLRFTYAYLGGFHDVAPGILPDEDSAKPQLAIGTCTAQ